ncbi:MAG: hypothetical protein CL910_11865 [Deltaproteobacteria bacterium]|jgi:hypothetical protein|nr:hypothetical protein [Deltaproteobacteria bacterium]
MNRMRWLLPLVVAVLLALPASGEIYRCMGADGKVLFTGDRSQCPGQAAHEPKAHIQNVPRQQALEAPPSHPVVSARRSSYDPAAEEAEAARWRARKSESESQLRKVDARLPSLRKAVGWCNRGDSVYSTDDLGIRRGISCDDLKAQYEELENLAQQLRSYLEGGLEEECRRAGCLPGWVR